MPAGSELATGLADPIVSVYAEAERIMLERVARRLAKGLASPSWAEEKLAEIQALRKELGGYMTAADKEAEAAVRLAIERAYRIGAAAAADDLATVAAAAVTNTYTVGLMVGETTGLLRSTYTQVLRSVGDMYRSVVSQTATQVAAGTMTRREATQAALWRFADQGVTGFRDRSGRQWSLASYTEMATRTGVGHAAINGHLETLSANGHDLVIVSNAPGECEVCRPWEGKVLSISGRDGGHFSIEDARQSGLFHPGCRHSTGAYFPGITPEMGETADPEGDEARQRLRYLERQVRSSKMREATALDADAKRIAHARVAAYQAKIRDHVDETGLIRQRHREQIAGTARLNASPKLPTAKAEPKWLNVNNADLDLVKKHVEEVSRVPGGLMDKFAAAGGSVHIGEGSLTTFIPEMKGVRPRGWPPHMTWDNVPGGYQPGSKRVIAGTVGRHGSTSLVLHELGHGVDALVGNNVTDTVEFTAHHVRLYDRLAPYLQQGGAGGRAGAQELFAESFADFFVYGKGGVARKYDAKYAEWLDQWIASRA